MLDFDKKLTKAYENAKVKITNPELFGKMIYSESTGLGKKKTSTFKVKVEGSEEVKGKISLSPTREGLLERNLY